MVVKNWFFENIRKSDVEKTTKTAPSGRANFPRYLSSKIIQIGQEFVEKSEIL